MSRWFGALALAAACRGAPSDSLHWREAWEILVFTDSGAIVDARASTGNTGVLRGQGHLRFDWWPERESPVLLSRHAAPADVLVDPDHEAVRISGELFGREAGGHYVGRFTIPDAAGLVDVAPGGVRLSPVAWQEGGGQWTVAASVTLGRAVGWVEAGKRGGALRGRAVVVHRGGDGRPAGDRLAAYVLGADLAIGVDRHGAGTMAWAWVEGVTVDVSDAAIAFGSRSPTRLDFRPAADLQVEIRRRGRVGATRPQEHVSRGERWFLRQLGALTVRRVQRGHATVQYRGRTLSAPAILLSVTAARTDRR